MRDLNVLKEMALFQSIRLKNYQGERVSMFILNVDRINTEKPIIVVFRFLQISEMIVHQSEPV